MRALGASAKPVGMSKIMHNTCNPVLKFRPCNYSNETSERLCVNSLSKKRQQENAAGVRVSILRK